MTTGNFTKRLICYVGPGGPVAIEAIRKHRSADLTVVGCADPGTEALYALDIKDRPVTIA